MSLKHGLLGFLNYKPATGYDIAKTFSGSAALFWHAKPSQIYRELDALEQKGWLTSEHVIQTDKPNKRIYTITEQGKAELKVWLSMPFPMDFAQAKDTFLMRLFFSGETDKENVLELIRSYQEKCRANLAQIQEVKDRLASYGPEHRHRTLYWELAALHGEVCCKAAIQWSEDSINMVESKELASKS